MPALVTLPKAAVFVPVRSLIEPAKVLLRLLALPIVSVVAAGVVPALPKTTLLVPPPLLAKEAMAGAALVKFTVAVPLAGVMLRPAVEAAAPNAVLVVALTVPAAVTFVPPV